MKQMLGNSRHLLYFIALTLFLMKDRMKAVLMRGFGGPEVLYIGETDMPVMGDGEVLVRVRATALNRADTYQRRGFYQPPAGSSEILGLEMAGEVVAVGKDCLRYKVGDRVFALLSGGGYAEYVSVDERLVMPIPEGISFEEAGGIAEVFLTAYQALFWLGNLQAGDRVLIHAGASGVGTAAIQLARLAGASEIFVTASTMEKLTVCKELGASSLIAYKSEDFAERVLKETDGKGVDVIIDFVAASYLKRNLDCIAVDGRMVLLALLGGRKGEIDLRKVLRKRVRIQGSTLRARSLGYKGELCKAFEERFLAGFVGGDLRVVVDRVLDWERVREGHEWMEGCFNVGKVILGVG